jgi:hypothetical protein
MGKRDMFHYQVFGLFSFCLLNVLPPLTDNEAMLTTMNQFLIRKYSYPSLSAFLEIPVVVNWNKENLAMAKNK